MRRFTWKKPFRIEYKAVHRRNAHTNTRTNYTEFQQAFGAFSNNELILDAPRKKRHRISPMSKHCKYVCSVASLKKGTQETIIISGDSNLTFLFAGQLLRSSTTDNSAWERATTLSYKLTATTDMLTTTSSEVTGPVSIPIASKDEDILHGP